MKVSTEWLSQYVSLENVDIQELAELITRSGIEIDSVEDRNKGVTKVVVGYVKSKEKHPDADKLNVCIVDAGAGEDLQIVCGAKNVDAGQKVPVALVGAKLPGGLEIKKAKLRGIPSQGMICSAKELGLNDKLLPKEQQEGILVLPENSEIGTPVTKLLHLDDQVLDFDLTPNRSDCLSMLGAAYEVGAIVGRDVKLPHPEKELIEVAEPASGRISVSIQSPDLCSRYAVRYISGVKIGVSPLWMQSRLMAAGVRPINNIVDITNYVMLEYGQPLHAFDADKIAGNAIGVREAKEGETLVTLDGQERKLEAGALLIVDGEDRPVGLAGVMGGLDSEVTETTMNIVLESAKFDGGSVRKTSRQLGLRSEASLRFEKEVDPARVLPALDRAASLMVEFAGGKVQEGVVQSVTAEPQDRTITLSLNKMNAYLGTDISALETKALLIRLHFDCGDLEGNTLEVRVPTRRGDITRDVDLIEEIARLYGYDNIPVTMIEGPSTAGGYTKPQALRRALRGLLVHGGWQETMGYSFIREGASGKFPAPGEGGHEVKLAMPMSEDRSVLRGSLLPGLIDMAQYNRNRKHDELALFEIGTVFHGKDEHLQEQPRELPVLGLLLTGNRGVKRWNAPAEKVDFFDLKGALESLFEYLGLGDAVSYRADEPQGFHPGRSASLYLNTPEGGLRIGTLGQLHPELQRDMDLEDTYVAELLLGPLYEYAGETVAYRDLPRFPAMQRDIAVVVDSHVEAGALISKITQTAGEWLESVEVFDIFTGTKLGEGKKSVALSLVYRHMERTLTDEEVTGVHETVIAALEQTFAAELRK
ncbi:phenylalanyl-tRNA synthetase beta subunit [Fontibacillus phaseoli]|uniref:Phenylalanine--tRNA ligase beta subunit n=1 Tax=Fontibacillus phaseoli TaxID=1416533 RepID=A0A369B7D9_9BACL|nr:phenylalanine--tRNA ligase subunit beta [Fontibacillus phaseoli]RCX17442.1 phenylalanyl-tRNA synthetase beta subunit [Fontibacillus phaseoli]